MLILGIPHLCLSNLAIDVNITLLQFLTYFESIYTDDS